jgi:hypothetical protein
MGALRVSSERGRGYPSGVSEAFYLPEGDRFVSTNLTRGPWSAEHQHAGPPAALVARAIEAVEPAGMLVARFTLEVLRPLPLVPLRVDTRVVRAGRRVQLVEASLFGEDVELARASAWRIRPSDEPVPEIGLEPLSLPGPDGSPESSLYRPPWGESYFTATEWRLAGGALAGPGPAAVWMRMLVPLVGGEEPTPLQRVLVVADSGNGISWELPWDTHLFVNTELTVHLARMPEGEWVCLDARSRLGPRGIGLAESRLWDERGWIGRGAQALLVAPRG